MEVAPGMIPNVKALAILREGESVRLLTQAELLDYLGQYGLILKEGAIDPIEQKITLQVCRMDADLNMSESALLTFSF